MVFGNNSDVSKKDVLKNVRKQIKQGRKIKDLLEDMETDVNAMVKYIEQSKHNLGTTIKGLEKIKKKAKKGKNVQKLAKELVGQFNKMSTEVESVMANSRVIRKKGKKIEKIIGREVEEGKMEEKY